MQTTLAKLITAEEFAEMPGPEDGTQQELVRGVIISMPLPNARHGFCCATIARLIGNFVAVNKLGIVTCNDAGVVVERNPDTVRGPDIAYWSFDRQKTVPKFYFEISPDLAIEVMSPSNTRRQLRDKVREYLFNEGKMVWIVDPEDRCVEIYRNPEEGRILIESAILHGEDALPGFQCKVADLFPPEE